MATLCPFSSLSWASRHLLPFSSSPKLEGFHLQWRSRPIPAPRDLTLACSGEKSSKKARASRALKSNEEICGELREFMSTMGLPEDCVPSTKELSKHGRKDLANIVRRRGYKAIKELLINSSKSNSPLEEIPDGNQHHTNASKDETEGQERKIYVSLECISSSSDSSLKDEYIVNSNGARLTPVDSEIYGPSESSVESFHLKAANFIKTGELDTLEDYLEAENSDTQYSPEFGSCILNSSGPDTDSLASQQEAPYKEQPLKRDDHSSGEWTNLDEDFSSEANESDDQTEINHLKALLHQKEMELFQLRLQIEEEKVLNLSCFGIIQIEEEKLVLFNLQAKTNSEIGDVQRNIAEKDVELHLTQEKLHGLQEVHIDYWANADIVEVAGNFNGWLHRIKMDRNPSSEPIERPGARKPLLWSTVLWLYPGVYEIKFIVDGQWRFDSQRETINSGSITNNVLRVDR
ncbi:protein PTST homolog 3, chloroplastic isoform X2 [Phoenix dactylifera]|uniref:Protein PTST homolog 3, chloroplastic isoform X2 n=1 Tax=Phoenix dactylifera TaxID=42345 RepID=A0A8B8JAN1_PHODC|nr:protein PTST homolog 3, chloroplastic isoform X2 [Phoenix dactylifera]